MSKYRNWSPEQMETTERLRGHFRELSLAHGKRPTAKLLVWHPNVVSVEVEGREPALCNASQLAMLLPTMLLDLALLRSRITARQRSWSMVQSDDRRLYIVRLGDLAEWRGRDELTDQLELVIDLRNWTQRHRFTWRRDFNRKQLSTLRELMPDEDIFDNPDAERDRREPAGGVACPA